MEKLVDVHDVLHIILISSLNLVGKCSSYERYEMGKNLNC